MLYCLDKRYGIFAPDPVLIYIIQKSRELFRLEDRIHYVDPIQMKDQNGIAAIHVASVYGNISALKLLLDKSLFFGEKKKLLSKTMKIMEQHYPERTFKIKILNAPGWFNWIAWPTAFL